MENPRQMNQEAVSPEKQEVEQKPGQAVEQTEVYPKQDGEKQASGCSRQDKKQDKENQGAAGQLEGHSNVGKQQTGQNEASPKQVEEQAPKSFRKRIFEVLPEYKPSPPQVAMLESPTRKPAEERPAFKKRMEQRIAQNLKFVKEWEEARVSKFNQINLTLQQVMAFCAQRIKETDEQVESVKTFFSRMVSQYDRYLEVKLPDLRAKHASLRVFEGAEGRCHQTARRFSEFSYFIKSKVIQEGLDQFIVEKDTLLYKKRREIIRLFQGISASSVRIQQIIQKLQKEDDPFESQQQVFMLGQTQFESLEQFKSQIFQYLTTVQQVQILRNQRFEQLSRVWADEYRRLFGDSEVCSKQASIGENLDEVFKLKSYILKMPLGKNEHFADVEEAKQHLSTIKLDGAASPFLVLKRLRGQLAEDITEQAEIVLTASGFIHVLRREKPTRLKVGESRTELGGGVLVVGRAGGLLGYGKGDVVRLRVDNQDVVDEFIAELEECKRLK